MDEIRYGIIGTGMMGIEHIENINALPGVHGWCAISDTDESSRNAGSSACADDRPRPLATIGRCSTPAGSTPWWW